MTIKYETVNDIIAERDALRAEVEAFRVEVEQLRAALMDAANEIEAWGTYASEYFRVKHDLAGTVAEIRNAARAAQEGKT